MTLLGRYTLDNFRRFFLLSLSSFAGLYLLIDFFEKVDNFVRKSADFSQYLVFFSAKVPLIVTQVVPLAVLMGVFMTIGSFSRSNELTAMQAGGLSLSRISIPLFVSGALISLAVLAAGEWVIPPAARQVNRIWQTEINRSGAAVLTRDRIWFREGEVMINIRQLTPSNGELHGVTLQKLAGNRPIERIEARNALWRDSAWHGSDVTFIRFDPVSGDVLELTRQSNMPLPLTKPPEEFKALAERTDEISTSDLFHLIDRVRAEGYDPTRYRIDLQGRFSSAFASLIMTLIGIPFALQRGRHSNLAAGIAISVIIGISYHLLQGVLLSFGYSGAIPVLIAAWAPNLFFALIGVALLTGRRS